MAGAAAERQALAAVRARRGRGRVPGQGVARGLYEAALRSAAPRAEAVVAFVERANEASRKVHVDGFGMAVLGGYEVHGRAYEVVAAAARPSA